MAVNGTSLHQPIYHPFPDRFCKAGDSFWDVATSWNTSHPEVSECFQQSVLVWLPCLFLWAMLPYQAYRVMSSRFRINRWSWISMAKTVLSLALAVLALVEMSYIAHQLNTVGLGTYPDVDLIAALIKAGTYMLSALYVSWDKHGARPSSGVLFFFWLLALIAHIVTLRHKVLAARIHGIADRLAFGIFMASFPLVCLQFILSCSAEYFPERELGEKTPCPEQVRPSFLPFAEAGLMSVIPSLRPFLIG
ncbi:hypothetical protein RvY_13843 [Ramazzottius varieornatus]|uniref:ABC transporter TMD0 domain-containing protein n=1 Tax=Ramazzottius varieornatus TaxID=947166 RepID=A0A1D1VPB1_RAMVA|nr:hypothetical protein RvY_13843 [Ramazzottius varieornatus]